MKYIDLHCDALTKVEGVFQVTGDALRKGKCRLQCFAAFVEEREGAFARVRAYAEAFGTLCEREGLVPVRSALLPEGTCALLTVENGAAVEGSLEKLDCLYGLGVRMITLTWNHVNEIGFPSIIGDRALGHGGLQMRETERGLTKFGRETVERMKELGMVVDVSHGSDKLLFEAADILGQPFVASHSGADAVYRCARNLTDEGIRRIADAGGVIGLDFCAAFLSDDRSAAGQRAAILAHAAHIVNVGGENVLALGSDFDGIPQNPYLRTAADMPRLLADFDGLFGARIAEKIAWKNALRVLGDCLRP